MKKKRINILIMPTDICNMHCIYCFHNAYHDSLKKMSLSTLKRFYDITFASYNDVQLIWHGGEPLAMGQEFFEKALSLQEEYPGVKIENRMQSNVTLMDTEMANLLHRYHVGVGTSYDGVDNENLRGNSKQILEGRRRILEQGDRCGIIMVLSKKNVNSLLESYEFFKSIDSNFTLNTYVSTNDQKMVSELELEPEETVARLSELYDTWAFDTECNIHVDYFERIIKFIVTGEKGVCKYTSCLGKWLGIRYDGQIVPCNRYFPKEYSMGNVWEYCKLEEAFFSHGFQKLTQEAIERRYKCQSCEIFSFCAGGCNNVALNEGGVSNNGGTTCYITRGIYKHIFKSVKALKMRSSEVVINPFLDKVLLSACQDKKGVHHIDIHTDSY